MGASLSASMTRKYFTENAKKEMIEQSWKHFPVAEVKTGDGWKIENKWGDISSMITTTTTQCVLKEVATDIAIISVEAAVDAEMTSGKVSGNQSGLFHVNLHTGVPVSTNWSRNLKGNVVSMGMNMVMDVLHIAKTTTKAIN